MKRLNRRQFLARSTQSSLAIGLLSGPGSGEVPPVELANPANPILAGTAPLSAQGDLARQMVDGIREFLLQKTAGAQAARAQYWRHDYRSRAAYEASVAPNRQRLRAILGVVDERVPSTAVQLISDSVTPAQIAAGEGYRVLAVRWPVLESEGIRVEGEGLLLEPEGRPVARVVAIPDADWTPEMLAGLAPGGPPEAQFARRLAENGCQVLVPALIDRTDIWSGIPGVRMTNEPHREFVYRMAFEMGRHVIGYEVQKVLAAVDWYESLNSATAAPIGVFGYGEGGLIAFYSAALDERIAAVAVSGYFDSRESVWKEPIYRDVWGLLREFGDAEVASLIAPRALVVEASRGPEVDGPPPVTDDRAGAACPNGRLVSPRLESVRGEVARAHPFFASLHSADQLRFVETAGGAGLPGSDGALSALLSALGARSKLRAAAEPPVDRRKHFGPRARLHRQLWQMVNHVQLLGRQSSVRVNQWWSKADASSPERWIATTKPYRKYLWEEVIGRLPDPSVPANPRTRRIFDEPKYSGYEVMLDVWPGVFAYGILLVPKGIRAGERRPVVVCQHGLDDRPNDIADPRVHNPMYHQFGVELAEEGFVVYAPQNPYIGDERFRLNQRIAHPLKLALFSVIIGQHQRTVEWLSAQPFVDPERIALYGISYGGKTAIRVPPLAGIYALSICAGDFNQYVWKLTSLDALYCREDPHNLPLLNQNYDLYEFNFGNVTNYAQWANLIAPRPFMVEKGHSDPVVPDNWCAYEYAGVRKFYARMGIPENTAIEFFNGPHMIHGVGTFAFLRKHLRWNSDGSLKSAAQTP
ncbi:MAG: dienelactone hydrolase family protein [Terriglobia bacterium]